MHWCAKSNHRTVKAARSLLDRADRDHARSRPPVLLMIGTLKGRSLKPRAVIEMDLANASEVRVATGTVEAVAQNDANRYGVKLGGVWFDGWGVCPAKRGDLVEIGYVERGRFRNVKDVQVKPLAEVKRPAQGAAPGRTERDRMVALSVGLKVASNYLARRQASGPADVEALAERYAEWLLRKSQPPARAESPVGLDWGEGD